jgi:hypothetical protein
MTDWPYDPALDDVPAVRPELGAPEIRMINVEWKD